MRPNRFTMVLCLVVVLLCCAVGAGGETLYPVSVGTLIAAHTADIHSSWGKLEVNPLLRSIDGRFRIKGVAIKSGIVMGNLTGQTLILRRWPKARKIATLVNFISVGVVGGVAIRNYTVRK